jgi:hypothetical protein
MGALTLFRQVKIKNIIDVNDEEVERGPPINKIAKMVQNAAVPKLLDLSCERKAR